MRSRVHEYGGGAYTVSGDRVWLSDDADGRIYTQAAGAAPAPLTAERPVGRFHGTRYKATFR